MKNSKIIYLLLTPMLIVGMSACNGNPTSSETSNTPTSTSSQPTTSSEPTTTSTTEPPHVHIAVEHVAKQPTCTEDGNSLYYSCSGCDLFFSDRSCTQEIEEDSWVIPSEGHYFDYTKIEIINNPTINEEGSASVKCDNCDETEEFNVAKLPDITLANNTLTWEAVTDSEEFNEADYYEVYDGEIQIAELGPTTLSYDLSELSLGTHTITVKAIFDNSDYAVGPGSKMCVDVTFNKEVVQNTDFNKVTYGGAGNYSFVDCEGVDKKVLKLDANGGVNWSGWNQYDVSTLYGVSTTFEPGKYVCVAEVKLGEESDSQMFYYGAYGAQAGWFPGYRYIIGLENCSTTAWTTITSPEFTLTETKVGQPEIAFGSLHSALTENSYLLVKNVRFEKVNPQEELCTLYPRLGTIGDIPTGSWFEGIFTSSEGLSFIRDNNDRLLKVCPDTRSAAFSVPGIVSQLELGTYKMSLTVKLGPDAVEAVNNIGFRCSVTGGCDSPWEGDNVFDLTPLSEEGWVTLTKTFAVSKLTQASWINLDFWVFTHNDEVKSDENYVLIKNMNLNKITISEVIE